MNAESVATLKVTVTSTNYADSTVTINVKLTEKALPTVTEPTATEFEYNGQMQALVNAGSVTEGKMLYKVEGGQEANFSESIPSAIDADDYKSSVQNRGLKVMMLSVKTL